MSTRAIHSAALIIATLCAATAVHASTPASDPAFDHAVTAAKTAMMTTPQKAYAASKDALDIAAKAPIGRQRDLEQATASWLMGESLTRTKHPDQALPLLDKALEVVVKAAPDSKLHGDILKSRGHAAATIGHVQAALGDFQSAYTIYQRVNEPRSQAMALQEIGSIYSEARDYPHELQYYAQARDIFGQDPVLTLSADNNRGDALKSMGQFQAAEVEFRAAYDIAQKLGSGALKAGILTNLASTEAMQGRGAQARAEAKRGLALASSDPEARSERPFLLGVLAKISATEGDNQGAARLLDQVFDGVDLATTSMEFKDFHEIAASVYETAGDRTKALEHLKAFKRLDDQGRALAASTNAALVAAKFDFANQATKIAELKVSQAQSKARFTSVIIAILLLGGLVVTSLITHAFFTMRRSRNRIRAVNTDLETSNSALEKALKAKTEFLATTSHEIRTPLNGILGMAQVMLADRGISAQTRERLGLLKASGDTMNAMVNDLLDVAKIENGALSIDKTDIDLRRVIEDAAKVWRDQAESKGLRFDLEIADCPARVVEDADRLRQILFNLMSNAVKFTDQGAVSISARAATTGDGERLMIEIADSGIGIPEDQQGRIFESFTQVDGSTQRQYGGTGLGLTICRNIASALGGSVSVASTPGKGSTFTVNLPLERSIAASPGADRGGLAGASVLIVDDNLLAKAMLRALLADKVRELDFAATPDEALQALAAANPDCVVVDGACLGRDGADPLAGLAAIAGATHAPVCALWPALTAELADQLKAAGATRVIAKPVTGAALIQEVEYCLDEAVEPSDQRLAGAA